MEVSIWWRASRAYRENLSPRSVLLSVGIAATFAKHELLNRFCSLSQMQAKSVSTAVVDAMLKGSQTSLPDGEVYRSCQTGRFPKEGCSSLETEMMKISLVGGPCIRKVKCIRDNTSWLSTHMETPSSCHLEVTWNTADLISHNKAILVKHELL